MERKSAKVLFFYAAKTFILRVSAIFVSKEDCRLCRLITEDRRIETWFYTLLFIFSAMKIAILNKDLIPVRRQICGYIL